MDTQYITCFITSTCKVFETMLNLPVETGSPTMKEPGKPAHDVSAIVGLGGDMEGSVRPQLSRHQRPAHRQSLQRCQPRAEPPRLRRRHR